MRTAFIKTLQELAEQDERIVLLTGDLGFSVLEPFAQKFPKRFYNVGIAEQNMAGLAAGLAREGFQVYIYSIANFPTLRCLEQIRYDICYHNLDVKVVSVGAGFSYGALGTSHHATEDLAVLRALPGMEVFSPCDPREADACVRWAHAKPGPAYLRLGKAGEPVLVPGETIDSLNLLEKGTRPEELVLTTGAVARWAMAWKKNRALGGPILSCCRVKPFPADALLPWLKNVEKIWTVEEHQGSGGFGSAVLEAINDLVNEGRLAEFPRIQRIHVPEAFVKECGSQDFLVRRHLTWEGGWE